MKNQFHIKKATIHLLQMIFGIRPEHIKDNKRIPENRPSLDNIVEVFEKIYNEKIKTEKSIGGFIEREIIASEERKEIVKLSPYYHDLLFEWINFLRDKKELPNHKKRTAEQLNPETFEELFYNPEHAELCLDILKEFQPPVIDATNNYIGKAKGIFPLWIKVLKNHKPEPIIKHFKDTVYKDLLNSKINGLRLSKDASEFRKEYKRLDNNKAELDIKTILSQFSQSGKLGR